jgi:DNA polymerase-1
MGGLALQALTDKTAITKEIYNVYWNDAIQAFVIPIYHPAFVFRNIEAFDDLVWAFHRAKSLLFQTKAALDLPQIDIRIARTTGEAEGLLWNIAHTARPTWTAIDWETDYADPMRSPTLAIGFCQQPGKAVIIPWAASPSENPSPRDLEPTERMIGLLGKIARNPNVKGVFHNGDFDVRVAHYNAGVDFKIHYDTLLSDYALDERGGGDDLEGTSGGVRVGSHRLKSAAKRYLHAPDWELDIKKYLKSSTARYSAIPRDRLYQYLAYDVHYTLLLREKHEELLQAEEPSRKGFWKPHDCVHKLLIPAQNEIIQMELDGIVINRAAAAKVSDDMGTKLQDLKGYIWERAIELGWPAEEIHTLNLRSPHSLKRLVYDLMGVKVTDDLRTKLGGGRIDTEYPTGKDTLTKLRDRDPIIQAILDFKKTDKLRGTYVDAVIERSEYSGRIHGQFTLTVTRTGRLSSRDPNLQNIEPSTKVFYEPDDDEPSTFVNADYKQLEVRVAARGSRDPNLIQACKGDIHGNISREIFKKHYDDVNNSTSLQQLILLGNKYPVMAPMIAKILSRSVEEVELFAQELRDELRNAAKPIIFGVIYGREAYSLATGPLQCSPKEAQKYIDNLFSRFSRLARWLDQQKQDVLQYGWIESETGRRRRFNFVTDEFEAKILKQTVNAPVQADASDICLKSFVVLAPELRELGWGKPKLLVHDAIGFSIKNQYFALALPLIKQRMEHTVEDPELVFEVDFKAGPNYMDLKKVKL